MASKTKIETTKLTQATIPMCPKCGAECSYASRVTTSGMDDIYLCTGCATEWNDCLWGYYDHTAVELDLLRAVMDGRGRGHLDEDPCRCRLCAEDRYDAWKQQQEGQDE